MGSQWAPIHFFFLHIICRCICNKSKFSSCLLFTLLKCVDYFSAFALTWILISLYATLLYSLAYPIYVIILFTLHVTIFIVTIIIFACFVPSVQSCWNKCTDVLLRFIFIFCTTIGFVILVVGVCALYVASYFALLQQHYSYLMCCKSSSSLLPHCTSFFPFSLLLPIRAIQVASSLLLSIQDFRKRLIFA